MDWCIGCGQDQIPQIPRGQCTGILLGVGMRRETRRSRRTWDFSLNERVSAWAGAAGGNKQEWGQYVMGSHVCSWSSSSGIQEVGQKMRNL